MAAIVTVTLNPALDLTFEVERLVAERKLRASDVVLQPGGGGINVARAAKRLGADVQAAWLGGGTNGQKLAALLAREGIEHHQNETEGDVRMSIHVEERATTDMYRFVLPGPALGEDETEALCAYIQSCRGTKFLVLSGSLPPALPADFYGRLAKRAPPGARVVLDTNGEPLGKGLAGDVYLAKPNRNELGGLVGKKLDTVEEVIAAAREIISARRVEALAVSMAEQGLALVTADAAEHVRAPEVQMVSAVGAGDSTVAGLVVGLARGLSLAEAARLGVASGTAAVLTPATDLIRREDVERLFAELSRG
jgi:6-phosphofructokinase 2